MVAGLGRFRGNLYLARGSVGGAFRVIPAELPALSRLGLPPVVASLATLARGLVLVTGATGSGKSTTLAALVDLVNRDRRDHIVALEGSPSSSSTSPRAASSPSARSRATPRGSAPR